MSDTGPQFQTADYVVFVVLLLASAALGIAQGVYECVRKKKPGEEDEEEARIQKRNLSVWPAALSVMASSSAAPLVLGVPAEMYAFGTQFSLLLFGYVIGVPLITHFMYKRLYEMKLTSIYEYLEFRYNKAVRSLCSFAFAIGVALYMGILTYAPAIAFSQATGVDVEVTIAGVGVVAIIYTAIGGLNGIIWVDAMQMLFLLGSILAIVIKGTMDVGGPTKVWDIASEGGRIQFDVIDPYPLVRHSIWTQIIGGMAVSLTDFSSQMIGQKFLGLPSLKKMFFTAYMAMFILCAYIALFSYAGVVIYSYYSECSPIMTGEVATPDQLMPFFVLDIFQKTPGVAGLFLAALLSASLSTIASGVNALSAITVLDIIHPVYEHKHEKKKMNEKWTILIFKSLVVFYGGVTIGLAYLSSIMGAGVLTLALNIVGVIGAPMLALFVTGIFMPCTNSVSVFVGMLVSLAFMFWVCTGGIIVDNKYHILDGLVLSLNTDGCPVDNSTTNSTTSFQSTDTTWTQTTLTDVTTSQAPAEELHGIELLYNVSYMWYSLIAILVHIFVSLLVSLLTGMNKRSPIKSGLSYMCCFQTASNLVDHRDSGDEKVVISGVTSEPWIPPPDYDDVIETKPQEPGLHKLNGSLKRNGIAQDTIPNTPLPDYDNVVNTLAPQAENDSNTTF